MEESIFTIFCIVTIFQFDHVQAKWSEQTVNYLKDLGEKMETHMVLPKVVHEQCIRILAGQLNGKKQEIDQLANSDVMGVAKNELTLARLRLKELQEQLDQMARYESKGIMEQLEEAHKFKIENIGEVTEGKVNYVCGEVSKDPPSNINVGKLSRDDLKLILIGCIWHDNSKNSPLDFPQLPKKS